MTLKCSLKNSITPKTALKNTMTPQKCFITNVALGHPVEKKWINVAHFYYLSFSHFKSQKKVVIGYCAESVGVLVSW